MRRNQHGSRLQRDRPDLGRSSGSRGLALLPQAASRLTRKRLANPPLRGACQLSRAFRFELFPGIPASDAHSTQLSARIGHGGERGLGLRCATLRTRRRSSTRGACRGMDGRGRSCDVRRPMHDRDPRPHSRPRGGSRRGVRVRLHRGAHLPIIAGLGLLGAAVPVHSWNGMLLREKFRLSVEATETTAGCACTETGGGEQHTEAR